LNSTRTHRRNTLTAGKARKTFNIAKAIEVGGK
jgi:hypothetical protein